MQIFSLMGFPRVLHPDHSLKACCPFKSFISITQQVQWHTSNKQPEKENWQGWVEPARQRNQTPMALWSELFSVANIWQCVNCIWCFWSQSLALIGFKTSNIYGSCPCKHEEIKTGCVWVCVLEGTGTINCLWSVHLHVKSKKAY